MHLAAALLSLLLVAVANAADIEGEVFILTKGGHTFKLPLVEVRAYDERVIRAYMHAQAPTAIARRAQLEPLVPAARERCKSLTEPHQADRRKMVGLLEYASWRVQVLTSLLNCDGEECARNRSEWARELLEWQNDVSRIGSLLKQHDTLSANMIAACEAADPTLVEYGNQTDPDFLWRDFSATPLAVSKSDGDGKFSMSVPGRSSRIALAAQAVRHVPPSQETYTWRIWVNLPHRWQRTQTRIMLANDNLQETNCSDCITFAQMINSTRP